MAGLRDRILKAYEAENRLHGAMIELTHRCPCDCAHCYLVREPRDELTTVEVIDLMGQLRDEGVFNLGLTGGEPFVRSDLPEILEEAHRHRFVTSLLTTGLGVGPAETALLVRCGVKRIEISLLGACAATHDGIMRRPGAFDRTLRAVKLLVGEGLQVRLKTTVLLPNVAELAAIQDLARQLGAGFQASLQVAPRSDGETVPADLTLTEADLAGVDLRLINAGLVPGENPEAGALLVCRAGRTVAAFGPRGEVYPCLMFRQEVGNIRERPLREILHTAPVPFLQEWRALRAQEVDACHGCDLRRRCQRCPGITYLETGDLRAASPSACALARALTELPRYLGSSNPPSPDYS